MFKLAVVGGPAKGKSFPLKESGETSIGRIEGNDIVLTSQKISKKHCVFKVTPAGVTVKDAGSSNGTFVNGILTKAKALKPGDRVSVGEFVLEVVKVDQPKRLPAAGLGGNVVPIGGGLPMAGGLPGAPGAAPVAAGVPNAEAPPQTPQEKIKYIFEKHILNFVYNQNEKHEWRVLVAAMVGVLVFLSVVLSVYPLLDSVADKLTNEAAGRALVLARQMVDRNAGFIYERQESRVDVNYVEKEPGVTAAYIVDMDQRIMAPARLASQSINDAGQSVFASESIRLFRNNENSERRVRVNGDLVEVAIPLRIFSSSAGKNITVAVGLVYFDRTVVIFDSGTEAMSYIQGLILAAIVGVIVYFSLYRLTLRPLLYLNDQIDQVLKGGGPTSVEKKFKMEEINPLIDIINSALQRAGQAGPAGVATQSADEVLDMLKFTAGRMQGSGMMIFNGEKKIVYWGEFIATITGVSTDQAVGSDIPTVARDAAFVAFCDDMFARAPFPGTDPVGEDFEFSGTSYRMEVMATGSPGAVKYYVITAKPAAAAAA